jgi:hypothetical protein
VFYLLNDPIGEQWIRTIRRDAESLASCYREGAPRREAYAEMSDRLMTAVRAGERVCAVFYGHPGVFVRPAHDAIRRARQAGYAASMFPGISAEDMLFADVGFDPAESGCQSHEATDFLLEGRHFDSRSSLVLWQVGAIGEGRYRSAVYRSAGIQLLTEALLRAYPPTHQVVVYEANELPLGPPRIDRLRLHALPEASLTARSTLLVPPLEGRSRDGVLERRLEELLGAE